MLNLQQTVRARMKTQLREEFMQMVVNRLDPTATSRYLPRISKIRVTEFDFEDIFCKLLQQNGVKSEEFETDQFDFIIWDQADEGNSEYVRFISDILCNFSRNHVLCMSFLEFVVKRNHVLARMVFRHQEFNIAYCLTYGNISINDFKKIAAWDLEIGSDIFRNNQLPVLLHAWESALIANATFEKMKQLVQTHGADIMLWTSSEDDRTNVNIFLKQGYIMNTEYCYHMEEKLEFMINCCPAALKKHVVRYDGNENAFTIVLSRCTNIANQRHKMIVNHVFQYIEMDDLNEVYNGSGNTLLDLVKTSGNAVVTQYLEQKFGSPLP